MLSGNLMSTAKHFEWSTPVDPVAASHDHYQPTNALFEPGQNVPAVESTVWTPYDVAPQSGRMVPEPNHVGITARPVQSGIPRELADYTHQDRVIAAHEVDSYDPYQSPPFRNSPQGRSISWVKGRLPAAPAMEAFLVGRNGYDVSNPPSEVYGGERYNLGHETVIFGTYEYWQKQGQDATLRPIEYEYPTFPVDKPPLGNTAPYTKSSRGTDTWTLPTYNTPMLFNAPSETALSDFTMANGAPAGASGFADTGRMYG
jgi:hypothetical protein